MSIKFLERAIQIAKEDDTEIPCSNFSSLNKTGTFSYKEDRDSIYCVQYAPDPNKIIVGYGDGGVEVLDVSQKSGTPKVCNTLRKKLYGEFPVLCIRNHPVEKDVVFIASSRGVMYKAKYNEDSSEEVFTEKNNEINTFDFSADGSEYATGGRDLNVRLYDTETNRLLKTWEGYNMKSVNQTTRSHAQRIFCLKYMKYHQDHTELRSTFVTGGWDNNIKVWDSRIKDAVRKVISGPHVCGDSIDIFGYQILTGSWTEHDSLQIHDLRFTKLMHTLPFNVAHKETADHEDTGEYVYCCRFYDPDTVVAGGSGTHSLQAVSIKKNEVIGEMKLCPSSDKVVMSLDTHPEGKQLTFGGRGTELHLAELS